MKQITYKASKTTNTINERNRMVSINYSICINCKYFLNIDFNFSEFFFTV